MIYRVIKLYEKRYLIPTRFITNDFQNAETKIAISRVDYNADIDLTIMEKSALEDALFSTETWVDI